MRNKLWKVRVETFVEPDCAIATSDSRAHLSDGPWSSSVCLPEGSGSRDPNSRQLRKSVSDEWRARLRMLPIRRGCFAHQRER